MLTEGPAQMLKFLSIFLERIELEKVQGSNKECKMSCFQYRKDNKASREKLFVGIWMTPVIFMSQRCSRIWPCLRRCGSVLLLPLATWCFLHPCPAPLSGLCNPGICASNRNTPVSFCSGQMKSESFSHYIFLYPKHQEKGIP